MSAARCALAACLAVALLAGCSAHGGSKGQGATMQFTTGAFAPEESLGAGGAQGDAADIPACFAMSTVPGGRNVSIPYSWNAAPAGTSSFALALVDTAPVAHNWVHWLVVGLPATSTGLAEGASGTSAMPSGSIELRNSFGFDGYGGPEPPIRTGRHPYVATLYALDVVSLDLPTTATLSQFSSAIRGHVVASATVTGRFGR